MNITFSNVNFNIEYMVLNEQEIADMLSKTLVLKTKDLYSYNYDTKV